MPKFSGTVLDSQIIIPVILVNPEDLSKSKTCKGLIDTGSTSCSVRENVVKDLGIKPCGSLSVTLVSGKMEANCYKVLIFFSAPQIKSKEPFEFLQFVTSLPQEWVEGFDVLIGMSILKKSCFSMKKNKYVFAI